MVTDVCRVGSNRTAAGRITAVKDVIEALLQEQIYDETEKLERQAQRIALWATTKWKRFVRKRKRERQLRQERGDEEVALSSENVQRNASTETVTTEAISRKIGSGGGGGGGDGAATETTSLLSFGSK